MAVFRRASRGAAGGPDGTDVASVCVLPASTDRAQPNALASRTGLDNAANSAGECGVRRESAGRAHAPNVKRVQNE